MLLLYKSLGTVASLLLAGGAAGQSSPVGTATPASAGKTETEAAAVAPSQVENRVTAALGAGVNAFVPGETVQLLLSFQMKPHWHMYWNGQNDSGQPPTWKAVDWPAGFELGAVGWPGPHRQVLSGEILDHIYEKRLDLVLELKVPSTATPGTKVTLPLHVEWMVCERMCVLEEQEVSITLPVVAPSAVPGVNANADVQQRIKVARAKVPRGGALASEPVSRAAIRADGQKLVITVPGAQEMEFYPAAQSPVPGAPIAGTVAKGEVLSVGFGAGADMNAVSGIVAWRKDERSGWEYDWVELKAAGAQGRESAKPARDTPAR